MKSKMHHVVFVMVFIALGISLLCGCEPCECDRNMIVAHITNGKIDFEVNSKPIDTKSLDDVSKYCISGSDLKMLISASEACDVNCKDFETENSDYADFETAKKTFSSITEFVRMEGNPPIGKTYRIINPTTQKGDSAKAFYFEKAKLQNLLCTQVAAGDPEVTGVGFVISYDNKQLFTTGVAVHKETGSSEVVKNTKIFKSKVLCPTHCDWCR